MLPPGEFFSNIFIVSIVPIVAIIPIFLIDNLAVAMQSSSHSISSFSLKTNDLQNLDLQQVTI